MGGSCPRKQSSALTASGSRDLPAAWPAARLGAGARAPQERAGPGSWRRLPAARWQDGPARAAGDTKELPLESQGAAPRLVTSDTESKEGLRSRVPGDGEARTREGLARWDPEGSERRSPASCGPALHKRVSLRPGPAT